MLTCIEKRKRQARRDEFKKDLSLGASLIAGGLAIGLLTAPRSGKESRQAICRQAKKPIEKLESKIEAISDIRLCPCSQEDN